MKGLRAPWYGHSMSSQIGPQIGHEIGPQIGRDELTYGSEGVVSFLGSSLNAVVVVNLEVTHAARFALKTTAAFNEEPKKENLAWKTERL